MFKQEKHSIDEEDKSSTVMSMTKLIPEKGFTLFLFLYLVIY